MTLLDYLALGLFVVCWLGYGPLLNVLARRSGTLNDDMRVIRKVWMNAMTHREIRLVDSQLMGHSINSASFFASTNLLLIAAVAGVLAGGGEALRGVAALAASAEPTPIIESKLALILLCLVRGFLDFIWSLRQMNYALALIGAAPAADAEAAQAALGQAAGDLLNPALSAFSQGVRGYYFALAAAAWLFGPAWLAIGVVTAAGLLVWRQAGSEAAGALRSARRILEPPEAN